MADVKAGLRGAAAILSMVTISSLSAATANPPEASASLPASCLFEAADDPALIAALGLMYRMEYESADSAILSALPAGTPGRHYFRGLNQFNRFNDRGDVSALLRAESLWTEVGRMEYRNPSSRASSDSVNFELYRGLSTLQLSYVAKITSHDMRAAHLGRKAAGQLRPLSDKAEAAAALALYDYYKAALLKGVDWLPFVKADISTPLKRLEASVPASRYLRDVLQTSLLWLYYDAGRYHEGLRLVNDFLVRFPDNRTYRQIRADFLYRRDGPGDVASARDLHEVLKKEYTALMAACPPPGCIPIGYLSSVGNLAKIYGKLGRADLRKEQIEIWSSTRFKGYLSWLPASLGREVDDQRK